MSSHSFVNRVTSLLASTGIMNPEFVSSEAVSEYGDSAQVVFRLGTMLFRIVRDRGQEFVDVASIVTPEDFFQFDDLAVASGWTTIDEVLAKRKPEDLISIFSRLATHIDELMSKFSEAHELTTRNRLRRAANDREASFLERLNRNSSGGAKAQ
jgi:hypothetical protein